LLKKAGVSLEVKKRLQKTVLNDSYLSRKCQGVFVRHFAGIAGSGNSSVEQGSLKRNSVAL